LTEKYSKKRVYKLIKRLCTFDSKTFGISVLGAVITAIPWYVTVLLNGILMRTVTDNVYRGISTWKFIIQIIIALILLRIPNIFGYRLNAWGSISLVSKLQEKIIQKWIGKDENKLNNISTGDLLSRIIKDCGDILGDFYFQGLGLKIIEPLITGVLGLITIFLIDFRLVIFSLIIGLCSAAVSSFFSGSIQNLQTDAMKVHSNTTQKFTDIIKGIATIKTYGSEEKMISDLNSQCISAAKIGLKAETKNQLAIFFSSLFEMISIVGYILIGLYLSQKKYVYFPDVMIAIPIQSLVSNMLKMIGEFWNYLVSVSVSAERIFEVIDLEQEDDRAEREGITEDNIDYTNNVMVELKDVNYKFSRSQFILKDINLKIMRNDLLTIVGDSGSGKTTLIKIILGVLVPQSGNIFMKGQNFYDTSLFSWRSNISYVQQETPLFDRTIGENIALGALGRRKKPSFEEVEKAAKLANAHDFIMKFPKQYDTPVGELGSNLSFGQRQRIVIARALVSNSDIIIFDEPTSSLDYEGEKQFYLTIEKLKKIRTVIISTHRIIPNSYSKIIVLYNGEIVERGTHESLMIDKGRYYELFYSQFNGKYNTKFNS
jgi:ABC-type multidrug transport system fused ATPase/permease subunit